MVIGISKEERCGFPQNNGLGAVEFRSLYSCKTRDNNQHQTGHELRGTSKPQFLGSLDRDNSKQACH